MTSLPVELVVALGAVFLSVALLAGLTASVLLSRQSPTQKRLDALVPSAHVEHVVLGGSLTSGRDPRLARWSSLLPKSAKDMSRLERRLASAGIHSTAATMGVAAAELVLPVAVALAALWWFGFRDLTGWLAATFGAIIGYIAPGFYVDLKIAGRRKEIRNGLPDLLDLLIVCLEAGSSLDQAVVKATDELAIAYPALAEELRVVTTETRAGKPRLEAFRNLAQRTRVEDVRALVAMLVQTDRFGTSVAQTLRTMANEMRTKRRQAAEERAEKIGVKLVFPLVFFLFPALYLVMLGPAVLNYMRTFPR
jgi:tight adherence protein C